MTLKYFFKILGFSLFKDVYFILASYYLAYKLNVNPQPINFKSIDLLFIVYVFGPYMTMSFLIVYLPLGILLKSANETKVKYLFVLFFIAIESVAFYFMANPYWYVIIYKIIITGV